MRGKVFAVDDQADVLELLAELVQKHNRELRGFKDGDEALGALRENTQEAELLILDLDLGAGRRQGMEILADVRKHHPHLPVVILTGKGTIDDAVKAMNLGATDFIEKDPRLGDRLHLQMEKLDRLLRVLKDNRLLKSQNQWLRERAGLAADMIGADSGLKSVVQKIKALADIPRPVLILGERGTGKELVAAALHAASLRRAEPFITVNCAALSESLAEAELFGHEKGAFTDARDAKPGKFELADHGTLFLDEIGNMPLTIQKKILRAIEYQSFERVRGTVEIQVDVRVAAATNADLRTEMTAGRFRQDLYDRLAFDVIQVPPLRDRRQDMGALCRFFIQRFRQEVAGVQCMDISPEALRRLDAHPFPGNVRELKNLIERAAYRCPGATIQPEDLDMLPADSGPASVFEGSLSEKVLAFEKKLLAEELIRSQNNMSLAARSLGLGYDQMRRLVKKHHLGRESHG